MPLLYIVGGIVSLWLLVYLVLALLKRNDIVPEAGPRIVPEAGPRWDPVVVGTGRVHCLASPAARSWKMTLSSTLAP